MISWYKFSTLEPILIPELCLLAKTESQSDTSALNKCYIFIYINISYQTFETMRRGAVIYENVTFLQMFVCCKFERMSQRSVSSVPKLCCIALCSSLHLLPSRSPHLSCSAFSTRHREIWREEICEYASVFTPINKFFPDHYGRGQQSQHWCNPCVIAAATPETIWTASSKAKTRLWWTNSSRSTGKPNRRSSRSPGRRRTSMWWRQTQIWTPSWRWGGM